MRTPRVGHDLWSLSERARGSRVRHTSGARCEEYDVDAREKVRLHSIQSFCATTSFLTADLMSRPEHSVHEGLEPRPLFCNPVLTMSARAIADNAFRDYSTMEELLEIEPPENEMYHLRQNESVLGKPFFHVVSTGEMEKADTFSRRLRELGVRAGYLRPPTIHDFRAEGLYLVGRVPPSPPLTRLLELT